MAAPVTALRCTGTGTGKLTRPFIDTYFPFKVFQRFRFFRRKKENKEPSDGKREYDNQRDGPKTEQVTSLKQYSSVRAKRSYDPPSDTEEKIKTIAHIVFGNEIFNDWQAASLEISRLKYKLLTRVINEFSHDIPNFEMDQLKTIGDVVEYFKKPVRDASSFDDLKKLGGLPRNLHIQLEPIRFDPRTDAMFGGVTAFPGRPTKIFGLKNRQRYEDTKLEDTLPDGYKPHDDGENIGDDW